MSLINQFNWLKLITFDRPKYGKIYFLDNLITNFHAQKPKAFDKNIILFDKLIDKKKHGVIVNK